MGLIQNLSLGKMVRLPYIERESDSSLTRLFYTDTRFHLFPPLDGNIKHQDAKWRSRHHTVWSFLATTMDTKDANFLEASSLDTRQTLFNILEYCLGKGHGKTASLSHLLTQQLCQGIVDPPQGHAGRHLKELSDLVVIQNQHIHYPQGHGFE